MEFDITQNPDGVTLDQTQCVEKLESPVIKPQIDEQERDLFNKEDLSLFGRLIRKLTSAVQGICPDMAFEAVKMGSRFKTATGDDLIRVGE